MFLTASVRVAYAFSAFDCFRKEDKLQTNLRFSSVSLETGQLVRHHYAVSQLPTLYVIEQRLPGPCHGYQVSLLPSAGPR